MSNRSGPWQIWVSNVDGSDPMQLSHTDSAGTPRWSPDGGSIVFDAPTDEGSGIYMIAADGRGGARLVVQGQVPSFSRDGRYVYFASDRSGDLQVWKVPLNGGQPQQVTRRGGFAALEGSDGYLYYTKQPGNNPEICRVAVSGSDENCTLPHLRPRTWSSWAVTRHGIMFAEDMPGGKAALSVYEPAKQQVRDLVWLPSPPVWMGARPDGTQAIVNDVAERRISVVENLR
jgi:dipeptidyl aminopeptidase/acylaminoacyl peptidase